MTKPARFDVLIRFFLVGASRDPNVIGDFEIRGSVEFTDSAESRSLGADGLTFICFICRTIFLGLELLKKWSPETRQSGREKSIRLTKPKQSLQLFLNFPYKRNSNQAERHSPFFKKITIKML